jgi:hypothetical protein
LAVKSILLLWAILLLLLLPLLLPFMVALLQQEQRCVERATTARQVE